VFGLDGRIRAQRLRELTSINPGDARFVDGTVDFRSAQFEGGTVDFEAATGRRPRGLPDGMADHLSQ